MKVNYRLLPFAVCSALIIISLSFVVKNSTEGYSHTEDKHRTISTAEYQFALSLFQREFPPRDQITITNGTGLKGAYYVRPLTNGNIRINMGNLYDNLLA